MTRSTLFRAGATALVLTALSFVAGVAGDLTQANVPQTSGERVVVMIPQEAIRAAPLPPLTAPAAAAEPIAHVETAASAPRPVLRRVKPRREVQNVSYTQKVDRDRAPKAHFDA